ncbi:MULTISPECIES: hypothetical protein [Chroococcidiopsis]|jgi:hypothetical protein|uniref:Cyclase/dehydrase n=2 Tax=Chroococcidiopsis TaxID=54298 RepID=K9TZ03_CHRTP|nr:MULTISPECIES: hypothetical protein [Chroococcidiopsis]MBE9014971.1 hypothetical protein [Chroococcidiopsidales cyanobacterium LEGE 13417]PSB49871.1 hypothetical protein C7B80_00415 [Cyanosarcina cf. burmensis CCALA 770]AFY87618.1 hypothetical protein Chro_2111 [Chroococcidiopsis thermalis PCC 7203]MDZ4874855.1 hypothetical protein [Chroococcidiopsis cubana SAG 39.79]PSB58078.1 hypothetical protein C7B79_30260 [Chroococcidiopsis cubana CCALA 043]
MTNISADTRIPFPCHLVYATYRDKLNDLIPYMHNVRSVQIKSRREENGKVYTINEWHGGGEIPAAARAILSEDMLSWTEYNTWDESNLTLEWQIKTHAFTEAVHCGGKNQFIAEGDTTLIQSRGAMSIDPHQMKGVPWFLTGTIAHVVEDFLGKKIEPNLLQMSEGVRHFLEQATKNRSL